MTWGKHHVQAYIIKGKQTGLKDGLTAFVSTSRAVNYRIHVSHALGCTWRHIEGSHVKKEEMYISVNAIDGLGLDQQL